MTAETVEGDETTTPGLKEQNLRFVLLKAIADAAAEELGKLRAGHLEPMLARYEDEGTTSFKVRLPGTDSLIATVALAVPKDKLEVDDEAAFTAWLARHHKDAVETLVIPGEPEHVVTIPATEDRTETILVDKKVTAVMKQFKVTEGGLVDTATGLLVDGVKNVAGGKPRSFSVKYEPDGRDQLAGAYRAGKLDAVVAGTSLPEVGARREVERRLEIVRVVEEPLCGCGGRHEVCPGLPGDIAAELAPVAPPENQAPVRPTSLEEAFGEDVSPARRALEEHADEIVAAYDYSGSHGRLNGVGTPLAPADEDFDPGSW